MLFGTAKIERIEGTERVEGIDAIPGGAPAIERFRDEPLVLENVEILQVAFEIAGREAEAMLPPALHPTIPALVNWLVWRCQDGPLGRFTMAQTRVSCRSGVRPRAFLVAAVIDPPEAGARLAAEWGYRCEPGEVSLRRGYDRISAVVSRAGRAILDVSLLDPDPLGVDDVQYTASMNLARTPNGLRLVQVDPDHRVTRAERGRPRLDRFEAAAWGGGRIVPQDAVSASFAVADVTLPRVRFVCRPDVIAFEGTEKVA